MIVIGNGKPQKAGIKTFGLKKKVRPVLNKPPPKQMFQVSYFYILVFCNMQCVREWPKSSTFIDHKDSRLLPADCADKGEITV